MSLLKRGRQVEIGLGQLTSIQSRTVGSQLCSLNQAAGLDQPASRFGTQHLIQYLLALAIRPVCP